MNKHTKQLAINAAKSAAAPALICAVASSAVQAGADAVFGIGALSAVAGLGGGLVIAAAIVCRLSLSYLYEPTLGGPGEADEEADRITTSMG